MTTTAWRASSLASSSARAASEALRSLPQRSRSKEMPRPISESVMLGSSSRSDVFERPSGKPTWESRSGITLAPVPDLRAGAASA